MGKLDEEGNLFISGRKKEVIMVAGKEVYPGDVEDVLYTYTGVAEAAVVGLTPGPEGEVLKAFIALKKGETATTEEIKQFCRERLAEHEVPQEVEFRSHLPRTPSGKVIRAALRERLSS